MENVLEQLWWIDYIAGGVWMVLTGIMIWTLIRINQSLDGHRPLFNLGLFLLIFCWLYPLYTGFFSSWIIGEIGNVLTLIVTLWYLFSLRKISPMLSKLMIPQTIWLSIASIYGALYLLVNHL